MDPEAYSKADRGAVNPYAVPDPAAAPDAYPEATDTRTADPYANPYAGPRSTDAHSQTADSGSDCGRVSTDSAAQAAPDAVLDGHASGRWSASLRD